MNSCSDGSENTTTSVVFSRYCANGVDRRLWISDSRSGCYYGISTVLMCQHQLSELWNRDTTEIGKREKKTKDDREEEKQRRRGTSVLMRDMSEALRPLSKLSGVKIEGRSDFQILYGSRHPNFPRGANVLLAERKSRCGTSNQETRATETHQLGLSPAAHWRTAQGENSLIRPARYRALSPYRQTRFNGR